MHLLYTNIDVLLHYNNSTLYNAPPISSFNKGCDPVNKICLNLLSIHPHCILLQKTIKAFYCLLVFRMVTIFY